jgi:hypothetical protein
VQPNSSEPTTDGDLSGQDHWAERDRERQRELAERVAASREAAREMTAQQAAEVLARGREIDDHTRGCGMDVAQCSICSAEERIGGAALEARVDGERTARLAFERLGIDPEPAITAVLQRRSQERAREEELELALELEGPQR